MGVREGKLRARLEGGVRLDGLVESGRQWGQLGSRRGQRLGHKATSSGPERQRVGEMGKEGKHVSDTQWLLGQKGSGPQRLRIQGCPGQGRCESMPRYCQARGDNWGDIDTTCGASLRTSADSFKWEI